MLEKKCKYCAMMIPDEASVCPHCRKGQPMPVRWWQVALLLIFCFVVYTCAASVPTNETYKEKAKEAQKESNRLPLTEKGKKIKNKHPDWSNRICNVIASRQIEIGMTNEQVRVSWGNPYKINTTTSSNGDREQWVYGEIHSDYVYFENGIMTVLQQSK